MDDLIERLERSAEVAPFERVDVDALQARARRRTTVRTVSGLAAGVIVLVVAGFVIGPLLGTSVQIDDPVATAPGTAPETAPTLPEGASFVARVANVGDVTAIVARDAGGDLSLQGTARLIGRGMAPFELRYAVDHADTPADVLGLWERFGITEGRPDDVLFQWNEKVVFVMVLGDGCPSSVGFDVVDFPAGDTLQLVTGHADEEAVCDLVGTFQTFALAVDRTKSPLPAVQRLVAPPGAGVDRDHVVDFGVGAQDPDWPGLEDLANDQCLRQADETTISVHLPVIDGTIVDVDLVAAPEGGDARQIRLQVVVHEWLRGDGEDIVDVYTSQDRLGEPVYSGVRLLLAPGGNVDGHDLSPCGFSRLYTPELAAQWIEWIHGAP